MARALKYRIEKDVKKEIKKLLDEHNWFWWMPSANGFGSTGISDFCALRSGVFLAVEAKFEKNMPTPMQLSFLTSIQSEGGYAFVVNETRLEWFAAFLDAFDRATLAAANKQPEVPEDAAIMLNAIRELTQEIV